MFKAYLPKKFCREFVQLKGHSGQLPMIMATVKGLKPSMDDWVRADKYRRYEKICAHYGLHVMPDTTFKMVSKSSVQSKTIGGGRLNTTVALGKPFSGKNKDKDFDVHVFISKSKKNLERCFQDGWYPLIVSGRLIEKPLADNFRFGRWLGYPDCCVNYFRRYNNWYKYSHLYEIFKNTPGKFNFLCNPLFKNAIYSYIYHMPCSYECRATADFAVKVREAIREEEKMFADAIDQHLQLPALVFYEGKIYAFEGKISNGRLHYTKVYYVGTNKDGNIYEKSLLRGDCVFIEGRDAVVLKKGKLIKRLSGKKEGFASEYPFIIQFE